MIAIQTEKSYTYKHGYKAALNQVSFELFSSRALYVCNSHIGDTILALTQYCFLNSCEYRLDHNIIYRVVQFLQWVVVLQVTHTSLRLLESSISLRVAPHVNV